MATFYDIYQNYLQNPYSGVNAIDPVQGTGSLQVKPIVPTGGGSNSGFTFSTPTKEESEATLTEGMTDVGENKFRGLGSMAIGGILSAINPVLGMAYSLSDPNSMTRQVLGNIGFNSTTEGSVPTNDFSENVDGFSAADYGGGIGPGEGGQAASEAGMSEGMSDLAEGGIVKKKYATGGVVRKKYANGSMGINPVASIPSVTNIGEAILDSVGFTRHVADNQLLADAVARGEISPQDYNVLGGYNASQRMGLTPGMTALGTLAYQAFDKTPNVGSASRNVMGSIFGPMTPNQRNVYDSIMAGDTGVGTFGGYNDFDGTEGTFSTDTSDTGASSGGVDSAGDGGDGYATGGRVFYLQGGLASLLG
jgi:hypothetical protein